MIFSLGRLVATPAALAALEAQQITALQLMLRHQSGDWGDLGADDNRANTRAIAMGLRIFSAYKLGGEKFYVITEADRSSTCLLLANEY